MPSSIPIGVFVFGAFLLLVALLGGQFKIFGLEMSGQAGKRVRIFAGILAVVFLASGILLYFSSALATPTQNAPLVSSPDALTNRFNQFGYYFAWSDGGVENSAKVTSVKVEGNQLVVKYDWNDGELRGTLRSNIYSGTWSQKGARPGSGRFEMTFAQDFSRATGSWDRGSETTKQAAYLR